MCVKSGGFLVTRICPEYLSKIKLIDRILRGTVNYRRNRTLSRLYHIKLCSYFVWICRLLILKLLSL